MNTGTPMYGWNTIPWKRIQRNVFKLQKRIYQASRRGDVKTVHNCYIDIVMIERRPEKTGQEVQMTNAALLRSRMKANLHVRVRHEARSSNGISPPSAIGG